MEQQRVDVLSKVKCDRKVGHCLNVRIPPKMTGCFAGT
jgi:hypothetical protein